VVDGQLLELERTLGDIPHRVQVLEKELDELKAAAQERRQTLEGLSRDKRLQRDDLELLEEKLKRYQNQLYSVTTNREYDAITHEIETVKKQIEEGELKVLELEEKEENVTKELQALEGQVPAKGEEFQRASQELEQKRQEAEKVALGLRAEREELVKHVSRPVFASYERIRNAKGGVAVVSVRRGACGGCFTTIPPQRVLEIRRMDRLIVCEVCGRILVWTAEVASSESEVA